MAGSDAAARRGVAGGGAQQGLMLQPQEAQQGKGHMGGTDASARRGTAGDEAHRRLGSCLPEEHMQNFWAGSSQ